MRHFTIPNMLAGTVLSAFLGMILTAAPARGEFIATLTQVGSNVVATGSGTIDLAGLATDGVGDDNGYCVPNGGYLGIGPATDTSVDKYKGINGPSSFGSGFPISADSGSGDMVFVAAYFDVLDVPLGYVSGSPLSDTSTFDNQTFASMGITPGVYVWTWGSGANADSYKLTIGTPVPLPSAFSMAGISMLAGLGCLLWNRRKARFAA